MRLPTSVFAVFRFLSTFAFVAFALIALAGVGLLAAQLFERSSKRLQQAAVVYESVLLLSAAERSFFGVLKQALGDDYNVFAKIRLADLVRPVRGGSRSGYQSGLNRITSKHVDFVVCDAASLNVVAAIELDDSSHQRFERALRDTFVDSVLTGAGIRVLRVPARHSYNLGELQDRVLGRETIVGLKRRGKAVQGLAANRDQDLQ